MSADIMSLYVQDLHVDPCVFSYYEQPEEERSGIYRPEFSSIGFILQGVCHLTADGVSFTVRAGDIYLLPARSLQQFHIPSHPPGIPHCKYFCHFYAPTSGRDLFELIDLPLCLSASRAQQARIRKLMDTLCRLQADPGVFASIRIKSRLLELVYLYLSMAGEKNILSRTGPQSSVLTDILDIIDVRLAEPFSVRALAAEMHLSENHFIRLFRELTGLPPGRYILRRRLRRASDLLIRTSLPVADVARCTGFENPFYFSNAFKKYYGLSPSAFCESGGLYYNSGD